MTIRPLLTVAMLCSLAAPAAAKDPALGATTFTTYEAFMSPQQQSGEEADAPKPLVMKGENTMPSTVREQRKSRGWGQVRFNKDLTRAFVDVEITGVNPAEILMFHIHCGPPSTLGPIVIDFGKFGALSKTLANGKLSVELKNSDIIYVKDAPKMKAGLPESCPVDIGFDQTKTVGGLEYLARKGVLYFNLHTKAHSFYGEMRGQIYPVKE